jgi:hypothetical protein
MTLRPLLAPGAIPLPGAAIAPGLRFPSSGGRARVVGLSVVQVAHRLASRLLDCSAEIGEGNRGFSADGVES